MPKKLVLGLACLLVLLTVGGCWSRREVEDLAIIMVIGLDKVKVKGEDKIRTTLRIVRPGQLGKGGESGGGGGGGNKPVSWIVSSIGETQNEAGRNFAARSPRRTFLAHSQVIIIGEKLAKEGVHEMLDLYLRHKDIRMRNWVIIAKGEALDLITVDPELETLLSEEMSQLIDTSGPIISKGTTLDLKDFALTLLSPGVDPVTGWMEVFTPPENKEIGAELEAKPVVKSVRYHGGAVFQKDKLVGFLGDDHIMGYLYVKGEAKGGIIPFKLPGEKEKNVSYSMVRSSSKIKPVIKGGKITFEIEIESEGDLAEYMETMGIAKQDIIQEMEKALQSVIKLYAESVLYQAQKKYKADIFGFGAILHRKEPKIWKQVEKDWYSIYPDIPVKVTVKAKIRRTGMLAEPLVIK